MMDGSRFDGFVRALATGATRRRTLQRLVGGTFAGLLGHAGIEATAAACVKPGKLGCKGPQHGKCCSGAKCKRGSKTKAGRCVCTRSRKRCGNECVNTKTDDKHCGGCNKRCAPGHSCQNGRCISKRGCKAGQNFCNAANPALCDDTLDCVCITDLDGTPRCSDFTDGVCSDCTSNAGCPDGFVCFKATGPNCNCGGQPGSNGNACVRANCGGVSGSGTGRGGLRTPLLP
jgi:hypothetical protein